MTFCAKPPETTTIPLTLHADWIRDLYFVVHVLEAWDGPPEIGNTEEIERRHEEYVIKQLKIAGITHFYSSEFYGDHMS